MANRLLDLISKKPEIIAQTNEIKDKNEILSLLKKEIPGYSEADFANDVKAISEMRANTEEMDVEQLETVAGGGMSGQDVTALISATVAALSQIGQIGMGFYTQYKDANRPR
jgi:hypothetical protein